MLQNSTVTINFKTLLIYAKLLYIAEKEGNVEEIAKAKKLHDDYINLCRQHGATMTLNGLTYGDL